MSLFDEKASGTGIKDMDLPLRSLYQIPLEPYRRDSIAPSVTIQTVRELYPFGLVTRADLLKLSYRDFQFLKEKLSVDAFRELKYLILQTWKIDIEQTPSPDIFWAVAYNEKIAEMERESSRKYEQNLEQRIEPKSGLKPSPKRNSEKYEQEVIEDDEDDDALDDEIVDREITESSGPSSFKLPVSTASISDIEKAITEDQLHEFTVRERLAVLDSLSYFPLTYLHDPTERLQLLQPQNDEIAQYGSVSSDVRFYEYAMDLFQSAGHIEDTTPLFIDHSAERVVYFDLACSVGLSKWERKLLGRFYNVSELFSIKRDLGKEFADVAIRCFSIEVDSVQRGSCELISEITVLLRKAASVAGVIVLAKCGEQMIFAFAGYGIYNVLSDWYPIDSNAESLAERIHVANMSCTNAATYFFDFIYSTGRQYYFHNPRSISYIDIPSDYLDREGKYYAGKGEVKLLLKHLANTATLQYGEDYIEMEFVKGSSALSISDSDDLDLLLLDVDLDSDDSDNALDAEMEKKMEKDFEEFEAETGRGTKDEDEIQNYEDLSQEIFDDPLLLMKHLNHIDNVDTDYGSSILTY